MVVLDRFLIFSCDSICLNEDLQFHVLWVCYANQLTGFYMRPTLALKNGLSKDNYSTIMLAPKPEILLFLLKLVLISEIIHLLFGRCLLNI